MKRITKILLLSAVIFASCSKPKDGKDGAPGAQGLPGTNGTNGTNGNANVIAGNNTVVLTSGNWALSGSFYTATINFAAITQAIVDKGVVVVYEQYGSRWQAMPYTVGITERDFIFGLGQVVIYSHNTNLSSPTNPGNQTYRLVAISASNLKAHPNVNHANYAEVKQAYDLK